MKQQFTAVIIGAGRIGAFFDTPESKPVLTHAHALWKHPRFELTGFYDNDPMQSKKAAHLWKTKSFKGLNQMLKLKPDIIVIATPDETHFEILQVAMTAKPKLIFLEKPPTATKSQALEIAKKYKDSATPVLVNYSRRFCREFIEIKKKIAFNQFGAFVTGTGYYGKGLLHNGSHLIDLIRYWLGEVDSWQVVQTQIDYKDQDPTQSLRLQLASGQLGLQGFPHTHFTLFELDLLFEKGRVRMTNSGFNLELQQPIESPLYKGYNYLGPTKLMKTSLDTVLTQSLDHIVDHLDKGSSLICPLEAAIETQLFCHNVHDANQS